MVTPPWLFEMMQVHELVPPAGEAFSFITGAGLAYDDFEGEWPVGFESGPTDDQQDENVSMDLVDDLS